MAEIVILGVGNGPIDTAGFASFHPLFDRDGPITPIVERFGDPIGRTAAGHLRHGGEIAIADTAVVVFVCTHLHQVGARRVGWRPFASSWRVVGADPCA